MSKEVKTFSESLSEFIEIQKQFITARSAIVKKALKLRNDPNATDEDRMLASIFYNNSNALYGSSISDGTIFVDSNVTYNNMKVVVSPAGSGKTRYLVEEAITMSDYGRVLYITYEDMSDHIKKLICNNNINNIGNYENICISSCPQIRNIDNKLTWIINSISDAIKQYDFKYLIIDDLTSIVPQSEMKEALTKIYTKFFNLQSIIISMQTSYDFDNGQKGSILHMLYNVPTIIEVKKERITKENGDVYGQYETLKNCNFVCNEMTNDMFELYHYEGEFLIHRG